MIRNSRLALIENVCLLNKWQTHSNQMCEDLWLALCWNYQLPLCLSFCLWYAKQAFIYLSIQLHFGKGIPNPKSFNPLEWCFKTAEKKKKFSWMLCWKRQCGDERWFMQALGLNWLELQWSWIQPEWGGRQDVGTLGPLVQTTTHARQLWALPVQRSSLV